MRTTLRCPAASQQTDHPRERVGLTPPELSDQTWAGWFTRVMFLLFGSRVMATLLFVVTFVCGHCGVAAPQRVVREQQKVTLFFIPLFSFGTAYLIECSNCGMATGLSREQAEHSMQWADAHGIPVSA
jgi:hypothetical protein